MTKQELEQMVGQRVYWYDVYDGKMQQFVVPESKEILWLDNSLAIPIEPKDGEWGPLIDYSDIYPTQVACLEAIVAFHAKSVAKIQSCLDTAQTSLDRFKGMLAYAKEVD
jgi:hypothetical protein